MAQTGRRLDLDRAKGLAILLVVYGHIVARQPPAGNDWYVWSKQALYLFHMPFFMFLSGYVSWLSGAAAVPAARWPRFVASRAERLLVPFVLFGLLMLAAKLAAAPFTAVDNPPDGFLGGVYGLLWDTERSPALSIWYLAVLFVVGCLTPPLVVAAGGGLWLVALVAAIAFALPVPAVAYMDRVAGFWIFFVAGLAAARAGGAWLAAIDRWWPAALALLAALCVLLARAEGSYWTRMLICGAVALPALHGLVRWGVFARSSALLFLGGMSMAIYLFNTLAIGATKAVLSRVLSWDGTGFLVFAPVLFVAGVLGPVVIKLLVLRRIRWLDRVTA